MIKEKLITDLKFILSILIFITIIYPIRRFIYPFFSYVIKNTYFFACIILLYSSLYMCDFDLMGMITLFSTKLLTENIWIINWFFTPIISNIFIDTSPAMILITSMLCVALIKIIEMIKLLFTEIKMVFGDILIVILWMYYTLLGYSDKSVLLITKDEAKTKIHMYFVISIVTILAIIFVILPSFISQVNTTSPLIINGTLVNAGNINTLIGVILP